MKSLIEKIKKSSLKNILVIGDIMLDEYIFGSVSRISPEAPVLVLKQEDKAKCLGGAANVALNCKSVGCDVNLVGIINNTDQSGKEIEMMLAKSGISVSGLIKSSNRVTTCKKRALSNNHQLLRIDVEDSNVLNEEEYISALETISKLVKKDSLILISDYAKGVVSKKLLKKVIDQAHKNNCLIIVDPKGTDFYKYKNVDYIKPNYKEYLQILDFIGLSYENSIVENGKIICEKLSIKGLIVTLGEKGVQFISSQDDFFISAIKRDVYDLTGAGDTIFAFLALGLSAKLSIKKSLEIANQAASIAISHLKTYAVSLDDLLDDKYIASEKIFYDWDKIKTKIDKLKANGKKIVFTNGCFDLIHSGHLDVLNQAKANGDILVVAINTDGSVKRYKGKNRPIKPLKERVKVMAEFGKVDFVVVFDEDTPEKLIEYLQPDVLVKGGDYQQDKIAGAKFVLESGGKVEIVDFRPNLSTSNIVAKIKKSEQKYV